MRSRSSQPIVNRPLFVDQETGVGEGNRVGVRRCGGLFRDARDVAMA